MKDKLTRGIAIAGLALATTTMTPQPANAFIFGLFDRAINLLSRTTPTEAKQTEPQINVVLPVKEAQMMYDFEIGMTEDFLTGQPRQEVIVPGTGVKAEIGSEVYAIASGTITKSTYNGQPVTLPYRYTLNFDNGKTFHYMGVDLSIGEGSRVTKGQVIGTVAEPDMYFEYRVDGEPKNNKELGITYPKSNDFFDSNTPMPEPGCDENGCG